MCVTVLDGQGADMALGITGGMAMSADNQSWTVTQISCHVHLEWSIWSACYIGNFTLGQAMGQRAETGAANVTL